MSKVLTAFVAPLSVLILSRKESESEGQTQRELNGGVVWGTAEM